MNNPQNRKNYKKDFEMAEKKDALKLFEQKDECCGCIACYAICPMKAITMNVDDEGFVYPVIDQEKCICCYKCIHVCPVKISKGTTGV